MQMNKRDFLKASTLAGLGALTLSSGTHAADLQKRAFPDPISKAEREQRLEKLRGLMRVAGISALVVEPGSSMVYFSGMRWWRSERLTALVIGADGGVGVVTPYFEAPSVEESLGVEAEIRTWHEHENPFEVLKGFVSDKGVIAIEPTARFFVSDGIRKALPNAKLVSGADVVNGCRMHKTPAELALMQAANDVTIAAYAHVYPQIERGMRPADISALMAQATRAMGAEHGFALVLIGEASAYPHGSSQPQIVGEGSIVLMDCGCAVHDYESDISRTFVFGEASQKQRRVWDTVKRGQEIVMETAQVGTSAGAVDDAVRTYYESLGYGPGYKTPGLSHRTGHGIGMDGHEPINLVHGEATKLAPGMCFSNEPGIYIFGEFGVRLEDCFYMTDKGPRYFSAPQKSIERPV